MTVVLCFFGAIDGHNPPLQQSQILVPATAADSTTRSLVTKLQLGNAMSSKLQLRDFSLLTIAQRFSAGTPLPPIPKSRRDDRCRLTQTPYDPAFVTSI